jgi:adenine-specific DNA-methyltransferase
MGVATTAVVARDHGRRYLGAEIDPKYHEVGQLRLSGLPDASGCFPNLKTLRDYVAKTGEPIERFRFAVQVGQRPSARESAKIFSEEHHLEQLEQRLLFEEERFSETRVRKPSARAAP